MYSPAARTGRLNLLPMQAATSRYVASVYGITLLMVMIIFNLNPLAEYTTSASLYLQPAFSGHAGGAFVPT